MKQLLVMTALLIMLPAIVAAESVGFLHDAVTPDRLPYPGQPLKLEFELLNTKETGGTLRIHAVVDGRLVDALATNQLMNEQDRPTYSIDLHSPVSSLSYQAFLLAANDQVIASPVYSVQRSCNPLKRSVEESIPVESASPMEKLQQLEFEARRLEREIESYNRAFALLEELQTQLKNK